ncbi:MAG: hypothetical protein HQQ73_03700 [Desulfobulbaceae bacterium]|nr:hypothetical protein [Desulfobulbaceae bacterium]
MKKHAGILLLVAGLAVLFLLPNSVMGTEAQTDCYSLIENKCASCHFVDYICPGIRKNKGRMAWGWVINNMIKDGAKINREEKGQLTTCLSKPSTAVQELCANSRK